MLVVGNMSTLVSDLSVVGYFPFLNHTEAFDLPAGLDYDQVIACFCKLIAVDVTSLVLTRVDKLGWHTPIMRDSPRLDVELGLIDLLNGDRVTISKRRDNVGHRQYLKSLQTAKPADITDARVSALNNSYCGWRSIKGDGNCYYRAVYFSLFEQIVVRREHHVFARLHAKFKALSFADEGDQEEHEDLQELGKHEEQEL